MAAIGSSVIRARAVDLIEALTPDTSVGGATEFRRHHNVMSLAQGAAGSATDRFFTVKMNRGVPSNLLIEPEVKEWDGELVVIMAYMASLGDLDETRDRMREDSNLIGHTLELADTSGLHGYSSGSTVVQGCWALDAEYDDDVGVEEEPLALFSVTSFRVLHQTTRS